MNIIDLSSKTTFRLCPSDITSLIAGKTVTGTLNSRDKASLLVRSVKGIKLCYLPKDPASVSRLYAYVPMDVAKVLLEGRSYTGLASCGKSVQFEHNRNL